MGDAREEAQHLKSLLWRQLFGPPAEGTTPHVLLPEVAPGRGNVLGVGYGAKVVGGLVTGSWAVRVYVRSKRARTDLAAHERVPDEVGGRPTDVVAVGDIVAQTRPVSCGVSIGHIDITAGTLGCLVELDPKEDKRFILSNNHVLANTNAASIGDPILEPGPIDGGDPDDPIAELHRFVPIDFDGPNVIDAAVARLHDRDDVHPEILGIGPPVNPPAEASLYQSVRKHGRTTEHTVGVIVDVSADIWVRFGRRNARFDDQVGIVGIACQEFSAPGDSGSLIVDAVDRHPVGLLFAGGRGTSFGNRIEPILSAFDAIIVGEERARSQAAAPSERGRLPRAGPAGRRG